MRDYPHLKPSCSWAHDGQRDSIEGDGAFVDEILGLGNFEFKDGGITLGSDVRDLCEAVCMPLNHVTT